MKRLAPISDATVIASWLREEMRSKRFGSLISGILDVEGIDRAILTEPDLTDDRANDTRRAVLRIYRGYGTEDQNLLAGFPTAAVTWERVSLDRDELLSVLYTDWDYWLLLSGGTRRPADAADKILQGHTVYRVPNDGFLEIASGVRSSVTYPPIIAVTTGGLDARLVVIEGHSRLTGYALAADSLPPATEVLLGTSPAIEHWWAY